MRRAKISEGYTIIELSIAIAMMAALFTITVLSLTSSETTAKAGKIIDNMLNIKTAANVYYVNNARDFETPYHDKKIKVSKFAKYLNNLPSNYDSKYGLIYNENAAGGTNPANPGWYVRYTFGDDSSELRDELYDRILIDSSLGIISSDEYLYVSLR